MKLPALALLLFAPISLSATDRPNVILMMADDMGMGDTSAYQDFTGNADEVQVATPNMERLARLGVRFTDAHTPSSRCTPTRYGLLTGRHPWRSRMKWFVLFGNQGDPLIERDRPTLATLFRKAGYGTAITGKWHVGLRYTRADGTPAAAWDDADLTKPIFDGPVDHGFDFARFTSRSHGTSGPDAAGGGRKGRRQGGNGPDQTVGPGHLHDREIVGATGNGKELVSEGPEAYVLSELGSRFSDAAIGRLERHLAGGENETKPFFLYYPSPSNHSPYTPDEEIGGKPSRGAARTKSGEAMDLRHDYIHENDLILGRFLDWLETNEDPRNPGRKLIETTIVVFTSDNGAENPSKVATGPFRSHKGSTYEGGHRVPFLVAWPGGGIGGGGSSDFPICLTDLYATFSEILGVDLPDLVAGEKGAEDSFSVLAAWRGGDPGERPPLFVHDHKEAKDDDALAAFRLDDPVVDGVVVPGQWKMLFSPALLRLGVAEPLELYELGSDPREETNRIAETDLAPLMDRLVKGALFHRNIGGHRYAELEFGPRVEFDFTESLAGGMKDETTYIASDSGIDLMIKLSATGGIDINDRGLGMASGRTKQVGDGEKLVLTFNRDVIVQHLALVAGNGTCGGSYRVGDDAPQEIYCVDGGIDSHDQSGVLSDIGLVKAGETLVLDSAPIFPSEAAGRWRLKSVSVRAVE